MRCSSTFWSSRRGLAVLLALFAGLPAALGQDAERAQTKVAEAVAARKAGRPGDAMVAFRDALAAAERGFPRGSANDWYICYVLNQKAALHYQLDEVDAAATDFQTSATIYQTTVAEGRAIDKHHQLGRIAHWRAGEILFMKKRQYLQAEQHYRAAIDASTKGRLQDAVAASILNAFGYFYFTLGMVGDDYAVKYLEASSQLWNRLGSAPTDKAFLLNSLAMLRFTQERHPEAQALLTECIGILDQPATKDHEVLGKAHGNLGWVLHQQGDHVAAEAHHRKALAVWELRKGKSNRDHARSLSNIGWVRHTLGDFNQAKQLYEQAMKMRSDDLQQLALSKANLALLHATKEDWDTAFNHMEAALKDLKRYMARTLPEMPERLQISFALDESKQDSLAAFLHSALSLAYEGRKHPDAASRAATWLINCKAIAYHAITSRERVARDAAIAGNKEALQLLRVRQELSDLALVKNTDKQQDRKQLELETLAVRFGETASNPSAAELERWIDVREVQSAIGRIPNTVLIEYTRFKRWDFQSARAVKGNEDRYAALVIASNEINLVDLDSANKVDVALGKLTAALNGAEESVNQTRTAGVLLEKKEVGNFQEILKSVSQQVLWRVLPHAEKHQRWLISPDHKLWFVPWAALPDDKGLSYVVKKHTISCLLSGRELLLTRGTGNQGPPLMLAFPSYNIGNKQQLQRVLPPVGELLGTQKEAQKIEPFLHIINRQAQVKQEREALEGLVKQSRSPLILCLSTHGFFLEDKVYAGSAIPVNALLRCGVALAGCNSGSDGKGQDGVLTGEEVLGLDLRRTELVVLSACQTGLGNVQSGEGVASMRQAFHLAGARSVLATLWSVPDDETQRLLSDYFAELVKNGEDKAEALAKAQRALIKEYEAPTKFGGAHPFLWAAFTLTGDPGKL